MNRDNEKTTTACGQGNTKRVQKWVCDVCQLCSFPTMEEAVAHERECAELSNRKLPQKKQESSSSSSRAPAKKTLHAFFQPPSANSRRKRQKVVNPEKNTTTTTTLRKSTRNSSRRAVAIIPPTVDAADAVPSNGSSKTRKRKTVPKSNLQKATLQTTKTAVDLTGSLAPKPKSRTRCSSNKNAQQQQLLSWASISQDEELLAQQRTAEFQAQRRLQAQRERERQRKRALQFGSATDGAPTNNNRKACSTTTRSSAVRFPVCNHVVPKCSSVSIEPGKDLMLPAWCCKTVVPAQAEKAYCTKKEEEVSLAASAWDAKEISIPDRHDFLQQLLASCLIPPAEKTPLSFGGPLQTLPDDCCGDSLQAAARTCVEWVQEWKALHRRRCRQRSLSQQRVTGPKKRKRVAQKSRYYDDDDDFLWDDDSDQEDRDDDNAVCILTGPVGCGKSDLVRAVAATCDCSLLELSTAQRRGAAALRKAIGEATQSHKLSNTTSSTNNSTELQDDDDDSSSLAIILMDEVDNLYDSDNGFWTALSELSKSSKCPIFLTANTYPPDASLRMKHLCIARPTASQVAERLWQWLEGGGCWGLRQDRDATQRCLERVASLCHCDMRKLAWELESFACSDAGRKREDDDDNPCRSLDVFPSPLSIQQVQQSLPRRPVVSAVVPTRVRSTDYALLTITGQHFLQIAVAPAIAGYPVQVHVGEQLCSQARILDDSTILAVLSPCRGVTTPKENIDYAPIRVCGIRKMGLLSDSAGSVVVDDDSLPSLHRPVCLERYFPGSSQLFSVTAHKEDSDGPYEEFEFNDNNSKESDAQLENPTPAENDRRVAALMKEGMDAWFTRQVGPVPEPTDGSVIADVEGFEKMERVSRYYECMSDVALLEDVGMMGVPFLAGATPGFGFDLTGAYPKCTNDKNKRYVRS